MATQAPLPNDAQATQAGGPEPSPVSETRAAAPIRRPSHLRTGRRGEEAAAEHLEAIGCRILARNYRCRQGEIDLIADDHGVLVFVEVKTRSPSSYGAPRDAVTPAKRRKVARAASHYLLAHREQECAYRADIVEVGLLRGSVAAVRHLKGAFSIEAELEKLSE
jgi:putative endonuclease